MPVLPKSDVRGSLDAALNPRKSPGPRRFASPPVPVPIPGCDNPSDRPRLTTFYCKWGKIVWNRNHDTARWLPTVNDNGYYFSRLCYPNIFITPAKREAWHGERSMSLLQLLFISCTLHIKYSIGVFWALAFPSLPRRLSLPFSSGALGGERVRNAMRSLQHSP